MKTASTLVLAAVLALGTAAPAAAKKEAPAAQPAQYKFNISKGFRAAAPAADAAVKAGDKTAALAKLAELDALATMPDEKYVAAQYRLQLADKTNDDAMRMAAYQAMIASGSGAAPLPVLNFAAGRAAYFKQDYRGAATYFDAAERAGYKGADFYPLYADANLKAGNIAAGLPLMEKAIAAAQAAGAKPDQQWYVLARSAAYKAKMPGAVSDWSRRLVAMYPTQENWRNALVIYRDTANLEGNVNLDLYRLMRLTRSMAGEKDYYEYADLATERGLPGEALAVINEGFATSAAPSSSRPLNELKAMASGKVASDRAALAGQEKLAANEATGKRAAGTGDAYLAYGDDAKAIGLYRLALQKGGVDTNAVNMHLGIALARSGQRDAARAAFAAVTGPRAEVAKFWTLYLDQQGAA